MKELLIKLKRMDQIHAFQTVDKPTFGSSQKWVCCVYVGKIGEETQKSCKGAGTGRFFHRFFANFLRFRHA